MNKMLRPIRLAFLAIITVAVAAIYLVALYKLQIVEGEKYYEESLNNKTSYDRVVAARGNIMDRYGRVLVENRLVNNLVIDTDALFETEGVDPNATILELVNMVTEYGGTYTDTMPITKTPPFEYTEMSDIQRVFLEAYLKDKNLDPETSAVELMAYMRDRYDIAASYSAEEARTIAGVRYEINGRYSHDFATADYIFASDVSVDLIIRLMERDIPGFQVSTSYVREYNTSYASHILGYIGMMTSEELEKYGSEEYSNDALVGKDGVEYTFENYLHGIDGEVRTTSTASGIVTNTVYTKEPIPGDHIYLTLDIGLQEATENALNTFITAENEARQEQQEQFELYGGDEDDLKEQITGGAAVVVKIDSGEPLAIASWPGYDLTDLMDNYSELLEEPYDPLFNRALLGAYAPGSTFKPCTAIAGMSEGKIDQYTIIECEGIFDKYEEAGYAPRCWIYGQGLHGKLDVSGAITNSCNYFFYTVGDYLQISLLAKYADLFGLGQPTGIELIENIGVMTTDEYMQEKYGRDAYAGDVLQAAIGQAESLFSPMQIAEYCAAIANNGTRYSASILKSVRSYDFSETIFERKPQILSTIETDQAYYDAVHEGMRGVVTDPVVGSTYLSFYDAPYTVAAKTGTSQMGEDRTNNAVFMCYAPYENPEVAIALVVEKGYAGASIAPIARQILDYYFTFRESTASVESEGVLLR